MKARLGLALVLLLAAPVHAYEESQGAEVDARIASVSHTPAHVEPGTQWQGEIQFVPGHNITAVRYQICKVGLSCFAGPTLANQVDETTWRFDTTDYTVLGRLIDWGINDEPGQGDWRVGVQYVLYTDGDDSSDPFGGQLVPHGVDVTSDACDAMGWQACAETHYFAFNMEGRDPPTADAPGLAVPAVALLLLAVAMRSRKA